MSSSSITAPISSISGESFSSAPPMKIRPITEARWSTTRAAAGSRSMRAAISAWSVSGMRSAPPRGRSASMRIVSSTKSGFPSVFASTVSRSIGSSRSFVSASTRAALSPACSGSSSMVVARTRPPPQVGCTSINSGRAMQSSRMGAPFTAARCSISSSSGSSPQCTSSKTRTSGCACASCSAHARAAQAISCCARSPSTASSTPTARPSRSATASSSQHARSFLVPRRAGRRR